MGTSFLKERPSYAIYDQILRFSAFRILLTLRYRGISQDEKRYPDVSHFMPERFLDVNGALTDDDPAGYVFGSGRRACPGRYTVDATLWSAIATMLAAVEFSFAKDDQGKVIDFTPQFTTGLTRSSLVIFHHALISIQNLWIFSELDCIMYAKNRLSECRF